jgi:hypothetical protein
MSWGAIGAAAITTGGSLLANKGGGGGSGGEHGIDTVYLDDYDDYADLRKNLISYYQNVMQGQEPDFFQRYLPGIEGEMESSLNRFYLGDQGDRSSSAMGLAGQIGAATGVGPKATFAQQGKVANELAAKKAAAKAAMQEYRMNWMGQGQWQAGEGLQGLPQGQRTFSAPYSVAPQESGGGLMDLVGTFGGKMLDGWLGGGMKLPSSGNVSGTGLFGTKIGGQTQSEILGESTRKWM